MNQVKDEKKILEKNISSKREKVVKGIKWFSEENEKAEKRNNIKKEGET